MTPTIPIGPKQPERVLCSPQFTAASTVDVPICLTFEEEANSDSIDLHPTPDNNLEASKTPHDSSHAHSGHSTEDSNRRNVSQYQDKLPANFRSESASTGCSTTQSTSDLRLPPFIKPLPQNMDLDNAAFLRSKGAFVVPEEEFRAEILRSYIFSVHSFMPILDLGDFVNAILHKEHGDKVSLMLFQAVMFAGLSSMKQGIIQRMGYATTKQARKAFFSRVRLLYDFDTEPDNVVVLQSLLLMSFWYEKYNDQKHTWYWTGLGLSLAYSMGLHRGVSGQEISPKMQRLRRRLWWSLYIRDRLIALGTRRSMRIKDDENDVPMLTVQDFDNKPMDESFNLTPDGLLTDDFSQSSIALMCIELTNLCRCIGHVLSSQYTTLGNRSRLTSNQMMVPKPPNERAQELANCNDELERWYQNLDPEVQKIAYDCNRGPSNSSKGIHWSLLHIIYQTTVSVLHRPQILQPWSDGPDAVRAHKMSQEKVKTSARELTKIMHTMLRRDHVRFLPTSGVPALLSASLSHMLDMKSKDEDIRDASIFRFYQTMQVLQRLREIYASADSAVSFLASAVQKAGISGPIQQAAQATPAFMTALATVPSTRQGMPYQPYPPKSTVPTQLSEPGTVGMQWPGHQNGSQVDHTNRPGLTGADSQASKTSHHRPDDFRNLHDWTSLAHTTTADTTPSPSAGEAVAARTLYCMASGKGTPEAGYGQTGGSYASDPPLFWTVDEDYLSMNNNLYHDSDRGYIAPNYDFCSDAFGLLDGVGRDVDDTDTITVHISSTS